MVDRRDEAHRWRREGVVCWYRNCVKKNHANAGRMCKVSEIMMNTLVEEDNSDTAIAYVPSRTKVPPSNTLPGGPSMMARMRLKFGVVPSAATEGKR